jgi:hypothetical protein
MHTINHRLAARIANVSETELFRLERNMEASKSKLELFRRQVARLSDHDRRALQALLWSDVQDAFLQYLEATAHLNPTGEAGQSDAELRAQFADRFAAFSSRLDK